MNMGDIEVFIAVYEEGSIARAANRLYISPQGLSKSIARIESGLGFLLFHRSAQGMVPTRYARLLYPAAVNFIVTLEGVKRQAGEEKCDTLLRVCMVSGQLKFMGVEFFEKFESAHPHIELEIEECSNDQVAERVLAGRADVGFMVGDVRPTQFRAVPLSSVPHALYVGAHSRFATLGQVDYADLVDQSLVVLGDGYPVCDALRERAHMRGCALRHVIKVDIPESLYASAACNEVVVVGLADPASQMVGLGWGLVAVPFADKAFTWDVSAVCKAAAGPDAAADLFIAAALDWVCAREEATIRCADAFPVVSSGRVAMATE